MQNGVDLELNKEKDSIQNLLKLVEENPTSTQAWYANALGVSKRTVSRMFVSLQKQGILVQKGNRRKSNWIIIKKK